MQKRPALRAAMISGAVAFIIIGLLFLMSGDTVFGGLVLGAGVVELVLLPLILKKMEDMNR
ncbi:hypothetical protein [Deinococcus cellulosilyticus]|uniref:Uncharacterized protein n=1 Tax=Deinococcus cellulosilyticus (strain DSM 18568 / NBRC 106333 / KACC 11606 / 5516J-15) TaxID=1223518 RepID=A0A511N8H1_DEIC1|nr:hypothetical protein [Deinococcus cellulosilyticus]GEM48827.1 hypothetical protein DC3_44620 [Deinococcus cellulosilyticus NBRC 106333 = KACC 11606]